MNNRQAGRRRGRGGQRQGGNPGRPDNGNRIDNRARGNAAQLLEKYKNLALDSQRSGDRVNTEYYLQFADHYFRVLSESRSRNEDQGQGQQARRPNEDDGDDDDFGYEGEVGSPATFGQGPQIRDDEDDREYAREEARRQPRDDRPRDDRPREDRPREDRPRREGRGGNSNNANGNNGGNANGNSGGNGYARERDAEPRVTEEREARPAPAREREPRVAESRPVAANDEPRGELRRRGRPPRAAVPVVESEGFDASVLPPAIVTDATPSLDAVAEDRPRRGRPRRVRTDEDEAIPPAA